MNAELKTLRTDYIKHVETAIKYWINQISKAENITSAFHDEFSYNNDVDLNVTIKILPGQIQSGVTQYPGELMIEVNEVYSPLVLEALNKFAVDFDEDVVELDSKQYREFYALPNVVGPFQNNGIKNCTAISLSFSLIDFNDVMGLLSTDNPETEEPNVFKLAVESGTPLPIKWLNYAFSYASDTNSTGGIGSPQVKQIGETTCNNYTFTFVPRANNTVHQYLWNQILLGTSANRKYTLTLPSFNPSAQNPIAATATIECILFAGNVSQQSNGLPIMQVTFTRGDF